MSENSPRIWGHPNDPDSDNRSEGLRQYQDGATMAEKLIIAVEYLDSDRTKVGGQDYQAWLEDTRTLPSDDALLEFCEMQDDFEAFLG